MKSIEAAGGAAANLFKRITKDRPTSVLIPGGKSPIPFYHKLAKSDLNWGGITLLATDERMVSFSDENRNTKMIQLELLSNIKSGKPPALIEDYPQNAEETNLKLDSLSLRIINEGLPKAAFLGMGSDGHTAGLFTTSESTSESNDQFTVIKRPNDSFVRVSISMKVLCSIPNLVLFVTGKEKRPILTKVLSNEDTSTIFPVSYLLKYGKGQKTIICDRFAAPSNFPMGKLKLSFD